MMKVFTNVDFQNVLGSSTLLPLTPIGSANYSFCSEGILSVFAGAFLGFTGMLAKKTTEQKSKSIM